MPFRGGNGSLFSPSVPVYAATDQSNTPPEPAAPINVAKCFAGEAVGDKSVSTSIAHLLVGCSPSAIFPAIRAVIIDSINRQMRSMPVSCSPVVKIFKGCKTYINSSPPIIFITFIVRVATSVFHFIPNPVNPSFAKPMCCRCYKGALFTKATTALRMPTCERPPRNSGGFTAVALAKPVSCRFIRAIDTMQWLQSCEFC